MPRTGMTKLEVIEAAGKCSSKGEFRKRFPSEYNRAARMGWLQDVIGDLPEGRAGHPQVHTLETCAQKAKRCKTRSGFSEKYRSAYEAARKNGWLDQICAHMD